MAPAVVQYITITELQLNYDLTKIAEMSDDTPDTIIRDDTVVNALIKQQSKILEAFFRSRYGAPVGEASDLLKSFCATLTIHALYLRRGSMPPAVQNAYDRVMGFMSNLKQMDIRKLDYSPTTVALPSSSRTSEQIMFTEGRFDGFIKGNPNTDLDGNPT